MKTTISTALATTLCNVTGLSLSVGLSSALTTLAGQAKGELQSRLTDNKRRRVSFDMAADDKEENETCETSDDEPLTPLVFLYRGLFIQLALVIPVGIWWILGIQDTLIYLGQRELLASMTEVCPSTVFLPCPSIT